MFDCKNLDEFLSEYGDLLAATARKTLAPLHVPGRDKVGLPRLYRKAFEAQGHLAEAVKKQWRRAKSCLMVAEMGTGKTFMAAAATHARMQNLATGDPIGGGVLSHAKEPSDLDTVEIDPWTAEKVGESYMFRTEGKKEVGARTFEYAGEKWVGRSMLRCGVPGVTRAYEASWECYRVADADDWKGQSDTYDAVNHQGAENRRALRSKLAMGVLGIKGTLGKKAVVFHSPKVFRTACARAYRVAVVCPGQLVEKWTREIVNTVPGAIVYQVDSYAQILGLARKHARYKAQRQRQESLKAKFADANARVAAGEKIPFPESNEAWGNVYTNGPKVHTRAKAKRDAGTNPMGPEYYIIGRDCLKLSCGWKPVYRVRRGRPGCWCPKCGKVIMKPGDKGEPAGPDWFAKEGRPTSRRKCTSCGEQLWQETDKPKKYSPARIIQKKLKGFFDVGIIDEAHEYKSGDSLQGDAIGAIAGSCKKVAPLTGTLVGGYAWHVRTLLFRIGGAASLIAEGLGWKDEMSFNKKFGRIETKTVTSRNAELEEKVKGHSHGRGGKKSAKVTTYVRPGIMPTLFTHLLGQSVFLGLAEVSDDLPTYTETPTSVEMDRDQRQAYDEVDKALTSAIRDLIKKGNRKMLGVMLNCLLCYPDYAYDWGEIGYWDTDEDSLDREAKRWVHVVTPQNLDPTVIRPKERAVIDYCLNERAKGRQTWVYVCYTDKRDCISRLEKFMKAEGIKVGVMRSTIAPKDRERWIEAHGKDHDVIISHPQLVQTGLDFFSPKKGGHNFCSIYFYQTGYNLFTVMQAARRAWRIGQMEPCEVGFAYYAESMQARAMALMGKKMMAARNLNGQFSAEGLAAMAGDDAGLEMELAKSLSDAMPDSDKIRAWAKVSSTRKVKPAPARVAEVEVEYDPTLFDGIDFSDVEEVYDADAVIREMESLGVDA